MDDWKIWSCTATVWLHKTGDFCVDVDYTSLHFIPTKQNQYIITKTFNEDYSDTLQSPGYLPPCMCDTVSNLLICNSS